MLFFIRGFCVQICLERNKNNPMQEPRIVGSKPKTLVGINMELSIATSHLTGKLWGQFMPRRNEIAHVVSSDKYALQVHRAGFDWYVFDANAPFTKWAAMEVKESNDIPSGMETLELSGGQYAVFIHKGLPSQFPATLQYILNEWLPYSGYEPDYSRPQYELLGEKYVNNHPDSEEEIWFPIKQRNA